MLVWGSHSHSAARRFLQTKEAKPRWRTAAFKPLKPPNGSPGYENWDCKEQRQAETRLLPHTHNTLNTHLRVTWTVWARWKRPPSFTECFYGIQTRTHFVFTETSSKVKVVLMLQNWVVLRTTVKKSFLSDTFCTFSFGLFCLFNLFNCLLVLVWSFNEL